MFPSLQSQISIKSLQIRRDVSARAENSRLSYQRENDFVGSIAADWMRLAFDTWYQTLGCTPETRRSATEQVNVKVSRHVSRNPRSPPFAVRREFDWENGILTVVIFVMA